MVNSGDRALLVVMIIAAATPLVLRLVPASRRPPQVVVLLLGGILIGPHGLGLASSDKVSLFSDLGLGFLFLLAGYELDPALLRGQSGRRAGGAFATSLVISGGLVWALSAAGIVHSPQAMAIGLTTTALGILLPILQEHGVLDSPFGRAVFASGAFGELGPILCMALLLGGHEPGRTILLLLGLMIAAGFLAMVPSMSWYERASRYVADSHGASTQTVIRLVVVLLVGFLGLTSRLGFDSVLGAFIAGMVLRRYTAANPEQLGHTLETVGWSVFIPVFFVSSGMGLDLAAITSNPALPFELFALIAVVRGLPPLWWYRDQFPLRERISLGLLCATALPLLIAVTELAVEAGTMKPAAAASAVAAGVLSVIVFPMAAFAIRGGATPSTTITA